MQKKKTEAFPTPTNLTDSIHLCMEAGKKAKILNDTLLAMMYAYSETHKQSNDANSPQEYVTREAKISCSCGSHPILLDAEKDYGVIAVNGKPILTCRDCKVNINISSFGVCYAEVQGYKGAPRSISDIVGEIDDKHVYGCMPIIDNVWKQKRSNLLIGDAESRDFAEALKMGAHAICRYGGIITIEEQAEGKSKEELAEEAYQVLRQWLLEGYKVISQEKLADAMENLAANGAINTIACLHEPVISEGSKNITKEEEIKTGILKRIKSCMDIQDKYDVMVLAWANYWNMTMEKKYGTEYAQIRPEIIKSMVLVESDFGQENTIKNIIQNPERDIIQSVDPRNPVLWIAIGKKSDEYITIQRAESDAEDLKIDKENKVNANNGQPGAGQVRFFEGGSYKAVKEIVSADLQIYYAEKVTPELSLAIGVGYYCMNLNGTESASKMRSEANAVKRYNGGGDKYYVYKINIILENMGVVQLGE